MYPAEIKLFSPSRAKIKKSKKSEFFVYNLPSQAADLPSQAANSRSTALAAAMLYLYYIYTTIIYNFFRGVGGMGGDP